MFTTTYQLTKLWADVLVSLLENLSLSTADAAMLASVLRTKSQLAASATMMSKKTIPLTVIADLTYPSTPSASSGSDPTNLSSPSSLGVFRLHSIIGSHQHKLLLTLATSPMLDDELFIATPLVSPMHTEGPTTPINVSLIMSFGYNLKPYIVYHSDTEYKEVVASLADECFLYQCHGVFFNISVRTDTKSHFYCVTKGSHIGIFNGWDQAACEVLGVSGAFYY
ncbi:hypothetical protein V8B97DRAFT_2021916 [Scleroderma yunnanense]